MNVKPTRISMDRVNNLGHAGVEFRTGKFDLVPNWEAPKQKMSVPKAVLDLRCRQLW